MILRSFSWLAAHELVEAAEASVLPVREGVAKPQPRSTGSSISNSIPHQNGGIYPARFQCRPGRSQSDLTSIGLATNQELGAHIHTYARAYS